MSVIVEFNEDARRRVREPSLTDAELIELRRMLKDFGTLEKSFDKIAHNCPTARRELFGRE